MDEASCWQAVSTRDASRDGVFFYGVITTGVYCRPSCASRPLQKHVRYYPTVEAAEAAGLRACKRCRPREATSDATAMRIQALCRYIEAHADESLSLESLAAQVHLSPFHLQRRFKAITGVTPRQYQEACRLRSFKQGLKEGEGVARAIYGAGFGSASRVYERVGTRLGMTPKQYRAGGQGIAISWATSSTSLGLLMMGATDRGLCFVQFDEHEAALLARLRDEYPAAQLTPMVAAQRGLFEAWMQALGRHLDGHPQALDLPLDVRGTAFQMKVWAYLQQIPHGELRSYTEVAQAIGEPRAVRAVASACGANRVALLIPCHRVIRGDGSMGGYKWGLERKRALIDQERASRGPAQ